MPEWALVAAVFGGYMVFLAVVICAFQRYIDGVRAADEAHRESVYGKRKAQR